MLDEPGGGIDGFMYPGKLCSVRSLSRCSSWMWLLVYYLLFSSIWKVAIDHHNSLQFFHLKKIYFIYSTLLPNTTSEFACAIVPKFVFNFMCFPFVGRKRLITCSSFFVLLINQKSCLHFCSFCLFVWILWPWGWSLWMLWGLKLLVLAHLIYVICIGVRLSEDQFES